MDLFTIMIQRASYVKGWGERVIINEIEAVTGNTGRIVDHHILLQKYRFVTDVEFDEDLRCNVVYLLDLKSGWTFWSDLRTFCNKSGISMEQIINELDFSLFD
jgi:hypothetical protein